MTANTLTRTAAAAVAEQSLLPHSYSHSSCSLSLAPFTRERRVESKHPIRNYHRPARPKGPPTNVPTEKTRHRPADRPNERHTYIPSYSAVDRRACPSTGRLRCRTGERLIYRATERNAYQPAYRPADRPTDRQAYRPTDRTAAMPIERSIDRPTGIRPSHRATYTPTDIPKVTT